MVNPLIYRITCSSLVHLLSLLLDISLNCNNNNKIIYLLEIFRSSFNDFLTFKLLYNFSYSPFLK